MDWIIFLTVFGFTLGVFLLVMIGMALGVMLGRPKLTGSCGGLADLKTPGSATNCSLCTKTDEGCKERIRESNPAVHR